MAVFKPFKALRPVPDKAADIASLPYDVMDSDEARIEVKKHPLSYIHVEKPEVDLPWGPISTTRKSTPRPKKTWTTTSGKA